MVPGPWALGQQCLSCARYRADHQYHVGHLQHPKKGDLMLVKSSGRSFASLQRMDCAQGAYLESVAAVAAGTL